MLGWTGGAAGIAVQVLVVNQEWIVKVMLLQNLY
jgi:hypothetical protein